MSVKKTRNVLTQLFPKSFNRESMGTVTCLIVALERINAPAWHSSLQTFGKNMSASKRSYVSRFAERNDYLRIKPDPTDRRYRLYRITAKGKRLLARLERIKL